MARLISRLCFPGDNVPLILKFFWGTDILIFYLLGSISTLKFTYGLVILVD